MLMHIDGWAHAGAHAWDAHAQHAHLSEWGKHQQEWEQRSHEPSRLKRQCPNRALWTGNVDEVERDDADYPTDDVEKETGVSQTEAEINRANLEVIDRDFQLRDADVVVACHRIDTGTN